jgi:glutathione S-transferase
MKLYGSTTSPFVRRIRLFLENKPYEFINLDIFSAAGRQDLTANNPANKVPFIVDEGQTILDSRVIFRYLCLKYQLPAISWSEENLLTLIDAANDSLVSLLLCNRSGFDVNEDKLFFNLQNERVQTVFQALEKSLAEGQFEAWDYLSICLYCLLDWVVFRNLHDLTHYPLLLAFHYKHSSRALVQETDPR